MKNRLIVAGVGIPALLAVIFFAPLWGWAVVVAVMAAFSAWELTHTVMGERFHARFGIYAGLAAAAIPLGTAFGFETVTVRAAMYALFFVLFLEMMISIERGGERLRFADVAVGMFGGVVIPLMLSALVRMGMHTPKAAFILLTFVIVWITDSGAFFVGSALGKHKLAPHLSPKKSVEGAVGGLLAGVVGTLLFGLVYFYLTLPAINLHDKSFYAFFFLMSAVYCVSAFVTSGVYKIMQQGEFFRSVHDTCLIPFLLCVALVVLLILGSIASSVIFRSVCMSSSRISFPRVSSKKPSSSSFRTDAPCPR